MRLDEAWSLLTDSCASATAFLRSMLGACLAAGMEGLNQQFYILMKY